METPKEKIAEKGITGLVPAKSDVVEGSKEVIVPPKETKKEVKPPVIDIPQKRKAKVPYIQ